MEHKCPASAGEQVTTTSPSTTEGTETDSGSQEHLGATAARAKSDRKRDGSSVSVTQTDRTAPCGEGHMSRPSAQQSRPGKGSVSSTPIRQRREGSGSAPSPQEGAGSQQPWSGEGAAAATAWPSFPPPQVAQAVGKSLAPNQAPSPALGPEVLCHLSSLGDRDTVKYARHAAHAECHAKEVLRLWLLAPLAAVGIGDAHR